MTSVASGGTTERIVARILFKVLRAGSGTPARYSSMLFGVSPVFSAALRRAGLFPFTEEHYENFHAHEDNFLQKVTKQTQAEPNSLQSRALSSSPFVSFVVLCRNLLVTTS